MPGILVVCTANICRSPAAAALLAQELDQTTVSSAGTHALPGACACIHILSPAVLGQHRARALNPRIAQEADLILTATREHRASVLRMVPRAKHRTFTLRQAARIASWLVQHPAPGYLAAADPLVAFAEELDAARGLAPAPADPSHDDLLDPHQHAGTEHVEVLDSLSSSVASIVRAWRWLDGQTVTAGSGWDTTGTIDLTPPAVISLGDGDLRATRW